VAKLILLSRYRDAPAPGAPRGDRDLAPVAVLLWIASVARVALGVAELQNFDAEASLALGCALFLPCWLLWSWVRPDDDAKRDGDPPGGGRREAVVLDFTGGAQKNRAAT
jgi:hypothetical protein